MTSSVTNCAKAKTKRVKTKPTASTTSGVLTAQDTFTPLSVPYMDHAYSHHGLETPTVQTAQGPYFQRLTSVNTSGTMLNHLPISLPLRPYQQLKPQQPTTGTTRTEQSMPESTSEEDASSAASSSDEEIDLHRLGRNYVQNHFTDGLGIQGINIGPSSQYSEPISTPISQQIT